jgi:hypothetical protein
LFARTSDIDGFTKKKIHFPRSVATPSSLIELCRRFGPQDQVDMLLKIILGHEND